MWWISVALFAAGPLAVIVFGAWIIGPVLFSTGAVVMGADLLRQGADRRASWVLVVLGAISILGGLGLVLPGTI